VSAAKAKNNTLNTDGNIKQKQQTTCIERRAKTTINCCSWVAAGSKGENINMVAEQNKKITINLPAQTSDASWCPQQKRTTINLGERGTK